MPFSCDQRSGYAKRQASNTEVLLLPAFVLADFRNKHPARAPLQAALNISPSNSGPIFGLSFNESIKLKILFAGSPFSFRPII